MVVLRDPGEVYLLRHTGGPDAISWVERIDPDDARRDRALARPARRQDVARRRRRARERRDLRRVRPPRPPAQPPTCRRSSRVELPARPSVQQLRDPPRRPPRAEGLRRRAARRASSRPTTSRASCSCSSPSTLATVASVTLPERSIARLSADGDDVYVVGTHHLWRARWDGHDARARRRLPPAVPHHRRPDLRVGRRARRRRRVVPRRRRGHRGLRRHVRRARRVAGAAPPRARRPRAPARSTLTEICGLPNGIVANPPAVDVGRAHRGRVRQRQRRARRVRHRRPTARTTPRWTREQHHACHPILYPDTGELVTNDHDAERMMDQVVVLDIETGEERARVDTGSPLQSVGVPRARLRPRPVLRRVPRDRSRRTSSRR